MKLFKVARGTFGRVMTPDGEFVTRPIINEAVFEREDVILDRVILHNRAKEWAKEWPELDAIDQILFETHVRDGDMVFGKRLPAGLFVLIVSTAQVTMCQ